MRREEWAQWAQDALDYLTFCMAHRIMNEINLILAINALVVSKFRQCLVPPSQSAQATLCLSLLTRECCCLSLSLSLTSLCTFTMCHNEQRPPQPDAWVCPGLDCFAFRNQISSLRFPFSLSLALLSLLSPSPALATLSQIAIKTDS